MAQDVTVAGAAYSAVPSVDLPATGGGTASFYDVSATTATAADVVSGKTFYAADGALTTGTASGGGGAGVATFYGTCATAANMAAKAVVCKEFTSDYLVEGTVVIVKFTNAQTYNGAPTLNVNNTGAKGVKRFGTTDAAISEWLAGEVLQFVYDGTYWVITNGYFDDGAWWGICSTSATSGNKVVSAKNFSDSKAGCLVTVSMLTANTYVGPLTLKVNKTGAYPIIFGGRATSASNPLLWEADDTLQFVMSNANSWWYVGGSSAQSKALSWQDISSEFADVNSELTDTTIYAFTNETLVYVTVQTSDSISLINVPSSYLPSVPALGQAYTESGEISVVSVFPYEAIISQPEGSELEAFTIMYLIL